MTESMHSHNDILKALAAGDQTYLLDWVLTASCVEYGEGSWFVRASRLPGAVSAALSALCINPTNSTAQAFEVDGFMFWLPDDPTYCLSVSGDLSQPCIRRRWWNSLDTIPVYGERNCRTTNWKAVFAAALSETIGRSRDGELTDEDIRQVLSLSSIDARNGDIGENDLFTLAPVAPLAQLVQLALYRNDIDQLVPLAHHSSLRYLDASENPVTDLTPIMDIPLLGLNIMGCGIPLTQVLDYREKHPDCDITVGPSEGAEDTVTSHGEHPREWGIAGSHCSSNFVITPNDDTQPGPLPVSLDKMACWPKEYFISLKALKSSAITAVSSEFDLIEWAAGQLALTLHDYRSTDLNNMSTEHVLRWVGQFSRGVRLRLLLETNHVLGSTYISCSKTKQFLSTLSSTAQLAGQDPGAYWQNAYVLNIQQGGQSQHELTTLFRQVLLDQFNVKANDTPRAGHPVFYLDDVVFSGNRVRHDIEAWLPHCPLTDITLEIVVIGLHRGGQWYANNQINEAAKRCGKKVTVRWWRCVEFEDRKRYVATADVLRPKALPQDPLATAYEQYLIQQKYPPIYRPATAGRSSQYFASEDGRDFLEEQFLLAGLKVRQMCPRLPEKVRPLGFSALKTFGFGSLIVTYRNCPNTSALALWAGDPWYPLLPRKTNRRAVVWHEEEDYR